VASCPRRKNQTRFEEAANTREELEAAIRLEMEDICEWPTGLAISVVPHEDADRCDMIETIADRLRTQFDLKG
jgi:methionine synthase II (cobalamin-independent)